MTLIDWAETHLHANPPEKNKLIIQLLSSTEEICYDLDRRHTHLHANPPEKIS
jgi:hypothetical protein